MEKIELTINCKCCNVDFKVEHKDKDLQYCDSCRSDSVVSDGMKTISKCVFCNKDFLHYGEKILCSKQCNLMYTIEMQLGENNPTYEDDEKYCPRCKKKFSYSGNRHFCSLACAAKIKHEQIEIKEVPSNREYSHCQLCGCNTKAHCVHHIDYDESNLEDENLITLCQSCYEAAQQDKVFWGIIFSGIISGSKLVKKPWGGEIHIANNNDYCLKYLIFFKDKQFSFHYHKMKRELWHCVYGRFECVLQKEDIQDYFIFRQGDKIQIERGVVHQLQAIKNSILVEVSTRDYPEDSIRLINGIN